MKKLIIFTAIVFFSLMIFGPLSEFTELYKTDLEIYTTENIYYINGLSVTNEVGNEIKTFKNKAELKAYISEITSGDVLKNQMEN